MQKKGLNLQNVKGLNISAVLNLIFKYKSISRADIARISSLSPTTCTDITKILLDEGIIYETDDGQSKGGRRPIMLQVSAKYGAFIGVELNFNELKFAIYNMNLEEIYSTKKTGLTTLGNSFSAIKQCVEDYKQSNALKLQIKGMTVSVTGVVDFPSNRLMWSKTLNSKDIIDLHKMLQEQFEFDVYIENDANILAYTEKALYFNDARSLIYIFIGNGIGAGLVYCDQIVHGKHGYAGEIGHMTMDRNGPLCFCGKKGCLEVLASHSAIRNKVQFGIESGNETILSDWCSEQDYDLSLIVQAAEKKDRFAMGIINEEANILFLAIMNTISMFDPDMVVLGGLPDKFADYVVNYTNETAKTTLFNYNFSNRVVKSNIEKKDMLCYGAALLGLDYFFEQAFVK